MPKGFITCTVATKDRCKCYFQVAHISAVTPYVDANGKFSYSLVYFDNADDDGRFAVVETPEEIMQKIEAANG